MQKSVDSIHHLQQATLQRTLVAFAVIIPAFNGITWLHRSAFVATKTVLNA